VADLGAGGGIGTAAVRRFAAGTDRVLAAPTTGDIENVAAESELRAKWSPCGSEMNTSRSHAVCHAALKGEHSR